ncbi:G/U mismatch-specific DNA glycosylase [Myxococcus qinghaiensis]|uniref:G/U mismatch-specific DNA glycosylase n=1 Tax=Myxococcus qinghaiensis TaxID=2906758 RepID=UPI002B1F6297|nr:G/U mismatch-specific DNA glycosylase [Myxococcus qinghaiensis]
MPSPRGPTREQLDAAIGRTMPDILSRGLRVLFCGINPSLYSVVMGHHFARPGNRFWPTLHLSGFTPRQLRPSEQAELRERGLGITNVVDRATATADLLDKAELLTGAVSLEAKVRRYRPRFLAVLGMGAYRTAFARPKAQLGLQPETMGTTRLWVLPNPSGLNAHYQLQDLARLYAQLRQAADEG